MYSDDAATNYPGSPVLLPESVIGTIGVDYANYSPVTQWDFGYNIYKEVYP